MRYVWRLITRRCTRCGQSASGDSAGERVIDLNDRAIRIAQRLGRAPRAQNCNKCNHLVFEGEHGFENRCLLVDII